MDLAFYLVRQRQWFLKVFGPGRRDEGLIKHIKKELNEIRESPGDLEEWIDVIILGFEGAIRNAETVEDVIECLQMKQDKNINRTWPDWVNMEPDKPIEHVK
jgi:hypothetical protein